MTTKIKAVGLLSGGLDSTLAAKLMLEQGIEVYAINFTSPFCTCTPKKAGCPAVVTAVKGLGCIPLKRVALGEDYLEMVQNPRYGYGSGMNPCIDCRIMKVRKAGEYMHEIGASFVFTGEVLGQRPMSQHRQALQNIDLRSGIEGLIVRPLSAKMLSPSIPEQEGWLEREKLLEINGRSRKSQIALTAQYGITDYPCPAGGCLLTVAGFVRRMKDLQAYSVINFKEIGLLKVGRHFRLTPEAKLVVGRDQGENERLLKLAKHDDICFEPVEVKGPVAIGRGKFTQKDINTSLGIIARYCDGGRNGEIKIAKQMLPDKTQHILCTQAMPDAEIRTFRI